TFIFLLLFCFHCYRYLRHLHSFPTRRSSDLATYKVASFRFTNSITLSNNFDSFPFDSPVTFANLFTASSPTFLMFLPFVFWNVRSEEHTSELQSRFDLVCRLLLEKKKIIVDH